MSNQLQTLQQRLMVWYRLITAANARFYNGKSQMEKSLLKSQYISLSIPFLFYLKFKQGCVRKRSSGRQRTSSFAQPARWIFKLSILPQAGTRSLPVWNTPGTGDLKKKYNGEKEIYWGDNMEISFVVPWGTVSFRSLKVFRHFIVLSVILFSFLSFPSYIYALQEADIS